MTNTEIITNAIIENGFMKKRALKKHVNTLGYLPVNTYANWLKEGFKVKDGEKAVATVELWQRKGNACFKSKSGLFLNSQVEPLTLENADAKAKAYNKEQTEKKKPEYVKVTEKLQTKSEKKEAKVQPKAEKKATKKATKNAIAKAIEQREKEIAVLKNYEELSKNFAEIKKAMEKAEALVKGLC